MRRFVYALVVFVIAVIAVSPWLCGILLQKNYQNYVLMLNGTQNLSVTLINYHRGWMSSDATLNVKVNNLFDQINDIAHLVNQPSGARYEFTLQQHIIHGPFILHVPASAPTHFVLGLMKTKILFSHQTTELLAKLGVTENFIRNNVVLALLNGNYFNSFKLNSMRFNLNLPSGAGDFSMSGAEGYIWMNPASQNLSGNMDVYDLVLADSDNTILMSHVTLQLSQYKNHAGIWLGSDSVVFPDFIYHASNGDHVAVYGVNLSGNLDELAGELSGYRQISINKISFADQVFGPIDIQLSENKLNFKTLQDMLATYHEISRSGEMYESQLKIKLSSLLPSIIEPGSSIRVDKFAVGSPEGDLQAKGVLSWPIKNFVAPETMTELMDSADLKMNVHVAKPLVNDVIDYMAGMPDFVRQVSVQDRAALIALRDRLEFSVRQNIFLIADFERQRIISSPAADTLLDLQEKFASVEDYAAAVNKLFWSKDISLAASYWLKWQYGQIWQPYNTLMRKVDEYQGAVKTEFQGQIKKWLAQQYVEEKNGFYTVLITWSNGQLRLNGVVAQ